LKFAEVFFNSYIPKMQEILVFSIISWAFYFLFQKIKKDFTISKGCSKGCGACKIEKIKK
jgi:hypothetical protein